MVSLKDRIIHEALRQFSSKGFMSTSISDILESAGASKGGLYNHFKSKEELFLRGPERSPENLAAEKSGRPEPL